MARSTFEEKEAAVMAALPADGSAVDYAALVETLTTSGNADVVPHLRTMNKSGQIKMEVSAQADGSLKHTVRAAS